ncbi:MAG TPA: M20 family metallopeptidase [Phycisphaerae bacterium]|nr:M20 family metallopeptidase [Phycisphaerae bacterium]
MHDLSAIIREFAPRVADLRHEIHADPELGYEEHATGCKILERLKGLSNLTIRTGVAGTGIVATLNGDKKGPCIALRAELDCLPITEETGLPYASKNPGKMHACGHDGHSSCLVGAAIVLSRIADDLPGKVKFIWQPAEEGGAGGKKMCDEGVLAEPKVDGIFALHGWPYLDLGTVGVKAGPAMASTNPWTITLRGQGAHAAYPHKGVDPIVVASHVVTAIQAIASRFTDPLDSVVVTVGKFHAGTAGNIIPDAAELAGTIRTINPATRRRAVELFTQITRQTAAAFGATADVRVHDGYPVCVNDAGAAALVEDTAREVLGPDKVAGSVPASMGGEDFAYYAEQVPAAFWRLGVRIGDPARQPTLHQSTYNFPDEAIPIAIRMHCEIARRFLAQRS